MVSMLSGCQDDNEEVYREPSEGLVFASNGDGTCLVVGIGSFVGEELVIPDTSPDGDIVIAIADEAFHRDANGTDNGYAAQYNVKSVFLPKTVVSIGEFAFGYLSKLETIVFNDGLQSIGYGAFYGCRDVKRLELPESLIEIGRSAFTSLENITELVIPKNVTTLGGDAFSWCKALEKVTIDGNITTTGSVFSGCEAIESITINGKIDEFPPYSNFLSMNIENLMLKHDFKYYVIWDIYHDDDTASVKFNLGLFNEIPENMLYVGRITEENRALIYCTYFGQESMRLNSKEISLPIKNTLEGFFGSDYYYGAFEFEPSGTGTIWYYDLWEEEAYIKFMDFTYTYDESTRTFSVDNRDANLSIMKFDKYIWLNGEITDFDGSTETIYNTLYERDVRWKPRETSYRYDSSISTSDVSMSQTNIGPIRDEQTAIDAFSAILSDIPSDKKDSGDTLDDLARFWETALAAGSQKSVEGRVIEIDVNSINEMLSMSESISAQFGNQISNQDIELLRETRVNLMLTSDVRSDITITADGGLSNLDFDNVKVATPFAAVSLNKDSFTGDEEIALRNLAIEILEPGFNILRFWGIAALIALAALFIIKGIRKKLPIWLLPSIGVAVIAANVATFILFAPQPIEHDTGEEGVEVILNNAEAVMLSLPVGEDANPDYLVIIDAEGQPSGKYNVLTNTIDARISESGVYVVTDNRVSFSDIQTKSALMQESIEQLASRGIMPGLREDSFGPDDPITRAEYVSVILQTLSLLDPTIESAFDDVKRSDWFYSVAASGQKHGVISGYPDNTFRGAVELPKDQMVVAASNTLVSQMRYKTPRNVSDIIARYSDSDELAAWTWDGVALATRSGIMIFREDAKFNPADAMTRGDAAIILYRLFMKIW